MKKNKIKFFGLATNKISTYRHELVLTSKGHAVAANFLRETTSNPSVALSNPVPQVESLEKAILIIPLLTSSWNS